MKNKLITWIALVFLQVAHGQENRTQALDLLFEGFQTQNYQVIRPLLHQQVKIGPLPIGMNDLVVPQVLKQLPEPVSYTVTGTERTDSTEKIRTDYRYADGKTRYQGFVFNRAGQLIELDILSDAKTSVSTLSGPTPENTVHPELITVPFELRQGLIYVEAEIDGKKGYLLLDSGAPVLMLNQRIFGAGNTADAPEAIGVGGKIEGMGQTHLQHFNWAGISLRDLDVITLPLEHLERPGKKLLGIIGYEIFQDYELTIDYAHRKLTLVLTDASGNPLSVQPQTGEILQTVPFEMTGHIPVIPVTVSGVTLQMGIDSGAAANLLTKNRLETVSENRSRIKTQQLTGADQVVQKIPVAKVRQSTLGTLAFTDMATVFADDNIEALNNGYGLHLDGLVGYEFLKQYKSTLNFRKKTLTLRAR